MTQCDSCNCYKECPVTGFTVSTAAPVETTATYEECSDADEVTWPVGGDNDYSAFCQNSEWTSTSTHSPMVDISADVFGTSCISPNAHSSGTSYKYLNRVSKGCNSFGPDSFATLADTMS
jgi:hypothetical protein